jgi:multidrug efflux pump subunit AcrA (membrane-fusion protein)
MANEDEEIVVDVEQPEAAAAATTETVEKVADAAPEPKVAATPADDLAEQFEQAKADSARDRQARDQAERNAREARAEVQRLRKETAAARTQVTDSQYDTVASGLDAAQAESRAAQQEYQAAFEAADAKAMAAAQAKISRAEARIVRLDEAKADIEAQRSSRTAEADERPTKEAKEVPADQFEDFVGQFTEPTANWLRDHREWVTNAHKNAKLTAAHFDAVSENLVPDSPQYFERVETLIGLRKVEQAPKPNGNGKAQQQRRVAPPVAPTQASGGSVNGGGTQVRLTKGEVERANDGTHVWGKHDLASGRIKEASLVGAPIGNQEMARRKLLMQKDGLYDRAYLEQ